MKRSAVITWDQLKVGAVILVAIVVIAVAILKLGQSAHLFTKRYTLVSFVPNTAGLRVGGQVTVAGQLAGSVKEIEFLPVDADTMKNLRIVIEIDRAVQSQVRRDSEAKLKTQGLLGDKVFDISPGTPKFAQLQDGDTLKLGEALDYEAVLIRDGVALEGTHTSFFGVRNGVIRTAPLSNLILPGVTREITIEAVLRDGIEVVEEPIPERELHSMDELFITGTTTEVVPVTKLDGAQVGNGSAGPVTARAMQLYRSAAGII